MIKLLYPFIIAALIVLFTAAAHAEDGACHADGENVVCTKVGFDKLVDVVLDERARADIAEARFKSSKADVDTLRIALDKCATVKVDEPSARRPALAYAAGVIGSAAVAISPFIQSRSAQAALASLGLVMVGAGFSFVIP